MKLCKNRLFFLSLAILVCIASGQSVHANLRFVNRASTIVIPQGSRLKLAHVSSIKGWSQESIVSETSNSAPSTWVPTYNDGAVIGYNVGDTIPSVSLIFSNSNAINALDKRVYNNSNAIIGLQNELTSDEALINANSNGILLLDRRVTNNSNAIVDLRNDLTADEVIIRGNSNAIISCCTLTKQSSNAVVGLKNQLTNDEVIIKGNSNAILLTNVHVTNNSNAIVGLKNELTADEVLIRGNSNAIINCCTLAKQSSNAVVDLRNDLINDEVIIRGNSNAILLTNVHVTNNSNAIVALDTDLTADEALIRGNSNAIISCCTLAKQNSNAVHVLDARVYNNSNAIVRLDNDLTNDEVIIKGNSNAIIAHDTRILNNSNAIIKLRTDLINDEVIINGNSNAILVSFALTKQNSNSIIVLERRVTQNSNAIVLTRRELAQIAFGVVPSIDVNTPTYNLVWPLLLGDDAILKIHVDTCIDGRGFFILMARNRPDCIVVDPGVTVYFKDVVFKDFADTGISLGAGAKVIFGDRTTIELADTSSLSRDLTFTGNAIVNGFGNILDLESSVIGIHQHGNLSLQNICLKGVQDNNIRCIGNVGGIEFKNSMLSLSDQFTFTTGGLRFTKEVLITGPHRFSYETKLSSTISANSTLFIDEDATLRYAVPVAKRDLLEMTDVTSRLFLYGCSLRSTRTGLRLTKGTVLVDHHVNLFSRATSLSQAICLGNGVAADDLNIQLLPGAGLDIKRGILSYENVN